MNFNIKQLVRIPLRKAGYDLRRIDRSPELIDFLQARSIDLLLDVGANTGQFSQLIRDKGYMGDIVSFEPVRSVFETLEAHARSDRRWQVRHCAIGARSGEATINVAKATEFSSMHAVTRTALDFDEAAAPVRQETVPVVALDDLWDPSWNDRNVFLKVDTQGFEQQVLAGATMSLKMLKGVQLELPIVHLYEQVWHLDQALGFMRAAGFVTSQINPGNFHLADRSSLIEIDCVFRRLDAAVDVIAEGAASAAAPPRAVA